MAKTVLIIGARGHLGSQVLDAVLLRKQYKVKALIREGSEVPQACSNSDKVQVVRGDMMDYQSLLLAFQGVDVVISTAIGYMQGHSEIDTVGNNNVVDAVKAAKLGRYVFCSALTIDEAPHVEHFYNKMLTEDYMLQQKIPFVSLRPGAFLDQNPDYLGDGIKRGDSFAISMWDKSVPMGMIYTPELASYFADAIEIELPAKANGSIIDVGWSRPISMEEIVSIIGTKLDRKIRCLAVPRFWRTATIYTVGYCYPLVRELMKMFLYFDTGACVNDDTTLQTKYFGPPPTPEDAIGRYLDNLIIAARATSSCEHDS